MSYHKCCKAVAAWLAACCLFTLATAPAEAQTRARALMLGGKDMSHKADGMEVKVQKLNGTQWQLVGAAEAFHAGDKVKVSFWTNRDGYVYFINIAPSGKAKVLDKKQVEMNKDYELPEGGKYFEFDQEKGTEVLKVYLSVTPNQVFEDALAQSGGVLGDNLFSASNELRPRQKPQLVSVAMDGCGGRSIRLCQSRSLGFQPQNPQTNSGAVAIAQPEKLGNGKLSQRLNKDEAIVLEIRLNHF